MLKHIAKVSHVTCIGWVLALTACANFSAIDKPISKVTPEFSRQIASERSPELLVLVGFSGGGTRAAALAYGVLKTLADAEVTTEKGRRSLLHEVDEISSVSGGSFTSAYYGLRGDKIFEEFEERFLRKNIEGALIWQVISPVNWIPQMSGKYGRGDVAAEYYGKHIFDEARFADLNRPGAPAVVINATDLATGMRFSFTPGYFDILCADLDQYPLARAVTASSAVPVLFTPITVKSYAGTCGFELPAWVDEAAKDERGSTRKAEARGLKEFMYHDKRPWLHLVDGGIADNLGLRAFYTTFTLEGDPRQAFRDLGHPDVRHVLIISVNSFAHKKEKWIFKRAAPGLAETIGAISSDQIGRYNYDTLDIVRYSFEYWTKQASTPQRPVSFDFVEVSFNQVHDENQRQALNNIGTNFELDDDEVDLLIKSAGEVLRGDPEFRIFLERLNGMVKQP
ncbi:MAG: patatin-like phospholipase family protein [Desulfobacterales bacterium]